MGKPLASSVAASLGNVGLDPMMRGRVVQLCRDIESELAMSVAEQAVGSVRDLVTGPVIDALFAQAGELTKALSSGVTFTFPYRSKIAREFVMAEPSSPDHVWEPQTTKVLCRLSAAAHTAVVGGAYFGDQAVLMAAAMPPGGQLWAFEPNDEQRGFLQRNADANGVADRVHVEETALWSEAGVALRLEGDDALAHAELAERATDGTVVTTTITDVMEAAGVDQLDLIMVDMEGSEEPALQGAAGFLRAEPAAAPSLIFEIHRTYADWSSGLAAVPLVAWVLDQRYSVFAIRDIQGNLDMDGQPIELVPWESVVLAGPPHGFNLLAVKDPRRIDLLGDVRTVEGVSPKLLPHKDPQLHAPVGGF